MTDKKAAESVNKEQSSDSVEIEPSNDTPSLKKSTARVTPKKTKASSPVKPARKRSKTAVLALFVGVISVAGIGGMYYLQEQINNNQSDELIRQLTALNNGTEQRIKQQMTDQQAIIDQQIASAVEQVKTAGQTRIEQLERQVQRLEQTQPSDWLLHEAEYLIRIATRTMWMEHDTSAAISLLQDANARIKELDDPALLPVQQKIIEDVEALKLMPALNSEEVIMSLIALNKQVNQLQFAMASIPDATIKEQDLELTDNAADWRANLNKTWQRFMADFITVRRRTGAVEPLMSANHQQNLKENLALKLQQVQWAVSEKNSALYMTTLDDIQTWLTEYFDMGHLATAQFYQRLQLLKSEIISYDYPSELSALTAIRHYIKGKNITPASLESPAKPEMKKESAPTETIKVEQPKNPEEDVEKPSEKKALESENA